MKRVVSFIAVCIWTAVSLCDVYAAGPGPQPRHLLENAWNRIDTSAILRDEWPLYPAYTDRAAWNEWFGEFKDEMIKDGETLLNYEWKLVKASDYLAFERTGNRSAMESPTYSNTSALCRLILAELAEGKGRFMDQIIDGVWLQTERTTWVWSAHQYRQKTGRALPDYRDVFIDLGTQSIAVYIAAALYFFEKEWDKVDPSIAAAVRNALQKQVFDPYMDQSKWRSQCWLGFMTEGETSLQYWENWDPRNNWNTWCNSNIALTYVLARPDRKTLLEGLTQAVRSVDNYLDFVDMDGACDEGPQYWEHSAGCLYHFIHLLNVITHGKFGCWDDPQFVNRVKYISRVTLDDGWKVNFSDGPARAPVDLPLCYAIGHDTGIREIQEFAVYLAAECYQMDRIHQGSTLPEKLDFMKLAGDYAADMAAALQKAGGDVEVLKRMCRECVPALSWYPGTQHFIFRSPAGIQYAAKGGHNEESHNHNDVGTVILMVNGMPVLADVGPTTYMRQTFNMKERYSIWSMRSEWHNVPVINGRPQHEGRVYAASWADVDSLKGSFSVEMAGAYEKEACVKSLVRSCSLKGSTFTLQDRFVLESRTAPDEEHFIVPGEVEDMGNGRLLLKYHSFDGSRKGTAVLSYPKSLKAVIETKVLDDPRHIRMWGHQIIRIVLRSSDHAPLSGTYKIQISTDS